MRDLNFELKKLCLEYRDGSYATQYARERILALSANQLHELGFRDLRATSPSRPKHVQALVERWKAEGLSAGTIKNRDERAALVGGEDRQGQGVIARGNDPYGIARVGNT